MQKQYNVAICLDELHHTMRSLILEGQFHAILLSKFSEEEIAAHLPTQCQSFLQGIDEAVKREAQIFCQDFCKDFVNNQHKDYNDMLQLQKCISQFRESYKQSRTNIKLNTKYLCSACKQKYPTEFGLHNHISKRKCTASPKRRRPRRERKIVKGEEEL